MKRFLPKSLIKQLNAVLLPIVALNGFVVAGINIYLDYKRIMNEVSTKTANTLNLAQLSLAEPIWNLNQKSIDDIRDSLLLDEDVVAVKIVDEIGSILSQQNIPAYENIEYVELLTEKSLKEWTVKVVYFDQLVGVVQIITTNDRALAVVKKTTLITLSLTTFIVAFLGLLISVFVLRFIKKPVDDLKDKAIALAEGDLATEIDVSREDELGTLAKSFAEMRDAIHKKIDELEDLNDTLEKRVEERTKELTDAIERVQEARKAAVAANEAKSEFLANMSHELRTPMHGILGFAKLGKQKVDTGSSEKVKSYFDVIQENGQRLLSLLNDLLDLSKLEMNKQSYNFRKERLSSLVPVVVKELDTILRERDLTVTFNSRTSGDFVYIDSRKIIQVLRNLLANAIKFSKKEGEIVVSIYNSKTHVNLAVIDSGIGIPEEELETVFDKFVQSSKTKTGAGGTGLGLSISKQIVLDHQGEIWAENNPNGGAIFTVKLPKDLALAQQNNN